MSRSRIAEQPQASIAHPTASSELEIDDRDVFSSLVGARNEKLKVLEQEARVSVGARGNKILLRGDAEEVAIVERFLAEAASLAREGIDLQSSDIARGLRALRDEP